MNKIICIYKITNPKGCIYIGQTVNYLKRKNTYKNLKCNNQQKLYYSLLKYGFYNHLFEIIEVCERVMLNEREIYFISFFNSTDSKKGLNICHGGRGSLGVPPWNKGKKGLVTDEARKKMGMPGIGRTPWNKGIKTSKVTIEKSNQKKNSKSNIEKQNIKNKISDSVKELWNNKEYRELQTKQRFEKRGKYRNGIIKEKLRVKIDIHEFKNDYFNYMHLDEISKKYKISINTIYQIIKRENIKKRGYKCNQK